MVARLFALLVGAIVATVSWLILVPWDLSTVDPQGSPRPGGGADENAEWIIVALVVVFAVALFAAVSRWRQLAPWLAIGGAGSWLVLFGWRGAVSRVSGANFIAAALVLFAVPSAGIVVLVTILWSRQRMKLERPESLIR